MKQKQMFFWNSLAFSVIQPILPIWSHIFLNINLQGQISFQSQRRAMPKNVQTTAQSHSLDMLAMKCSTSFKLGFYNMWTENFKMYKLGLEKAEKLEIKLPTSTGSLKKQEFQKKICFCLTDYTKAFVCVDHNKLWEILQEIRIPDYLTCLLRNLYGGQEAIVRTDRGTTDCSK